RIDTVITVDTTSIIVSLLSKGNQKIDVMILNVHSSNLLSFTLLAQAVALDIISLVVCDEFNELVAKKTLEVGAYLYLKKSFDKEIVRYLWQFVLSEKIRREKARKGSGKHKYQMKFVDISTNNIVGENKEPEEKNVSYTKEQSNNIHEAGNDVVLSGKYTLQRKRGTKNMKENNEVERQNNVIDTVVRRKDYKEWTEDLHVSFMQVVHQLGEGRCYPNKILDVMNLSDLTRMQKCRCNNWRSPEERQYMRHLSIKQSTNASQETRSSFRKYGVMPYLHANVPNQQWNPNQIQRGPEFPFPTNKTNNIFAQGESSIQNQLYHPQFQVQPITSALTIHLIIHFCLPKLMLVVGYNNNIDHYLKCWVHRDYKTQLLGTLILGSRIVSSTYIGNAIINNYNLNVLVDNVTTYSSSAMVSDTYIGNVTFNGLGATNVNANSQQHVGEPIMSGPRNTDVASYENYVEGSNSNEKEDAYLNFNNMDYLFQNLGPPSANLPNEQGSEFDQVYSDDQNLGPPSANLPNEQDTEFDQVYSDDQVAGASNAQHDDYALDATKYVNCPLYNSIQHQFKCFHGPLASTPKKRRQKLLFEYLFRVIL
ncbi:hypothetical protein H5410_044392, partial [Solanum commersonii]